MLFIDCKNSVAARGCAGDELLARWMTGSCGVGGKHSHVVQFVIS